MKQFIEKIIFKTTGNQILNITDSVKQYVEKCKINNGLMNLSILHTSCSLMIQENADQTVLEDIKNFLNEIAPQKNYLHNTEGPDDMPAHLKSMLTQTNLTLSIIDKSIILGVWQGVFLLEHRFGRKQREVLVHLIGD